MGYLWNKTARYRFACVSLACFLSLALTTLAPLAAHAAPLEPRSLTPNNPNAGATDVQYLLRITYATGTTVGSLRLAFCSDSALLDDTCTPPVGFDASTVTLLDQSGVTGYSIAPGSTANEIILTRPPSAVAADTDAEYEFGGITNPASGGPLFGRVYTYPTSDASGPYEDAGGLALYVLGGVGVQAEVPPFLLFCIGESIVGIDCNTATEAFTNIGILSPLTTGAAQSQLVVATNAAGGYGLWVLGGSMTSGNNVLPAMAGDPSQQGASQFGINLRANTDPIVGQEVTGPGLGAVEPGYAVQNQYRFQSGDAIAGSTVPEDFRKYTVSYIVNVDQNQPGGVYATTLTYVALANF